MAGSAHIRSNANTSCLHTAHIPCSVLCIFHAVKQSTSENCTSNFTIEFSVWIQLQSLAVRCTRFRLGVFDIKALRPDTCMYHIIDVVLSVDCIGSRWAHKRLTAAAELLNIGSCKMNASHVTSKANHDHAWPSSINVAPAENPLSSFYAKDNISTMPASTTSEFRLTPTAAEVSNKIIDK